MMQQPHGIATEQVMQNINGKCNDKIIENQLETVVNIVSDETVCLAEDINNCFQNNFQNIRNDTGLLEPDDKIDDSEVFLEVQEIIKTISSYNHNKVANLMMLIATDEQLHYYTGITFVVLKKLAETALLIELTERDDNKSVSYQLVRDKIVLCLCRLKRNYSFCALSVLFGMSPKECEDNFYYMIALLSEILKKAIYWPEKEDILEETLSFIPRCFINFLDVRFILHCIEITIKKPPNCLKCSFCTHSLSKGCSTVKFIIAIAPSGLISFVSKTYGGLAPAQAIIEQSNILKLINFKKEAFMVNNYLAADLKDLGKQVKIVKPYILDDTKVQFSDEENKFNRDFETCYAQIERTLEKFSQFNILNSTLSLGMACCIDEIATVIAGLVNLQE